MGIYFYGFKVSDNQRFPGILKTLTGFKRGGSFRILSECAQHPTAFFLLSHLMRHLLALVTHKLLEHISKSGSVLKLNAEENYFEVILFIQLKLVLYLKNAGIKLGYSVLLKALQQLSYWNT